MSLIGVEEHCEHMDTFQLCEVPPFLLTKNSHRLGKRLTEQRFALSHKVSGIIVVKEMGEQARYLRGEPIGV